MKGLQAFVGEAIARDQDDGGAGILTEEEIQALEWAIMRPRIPGDPTEDGAEHRTVLAGLMHQLGNVRMHIHGQATRVEAYYLHCADVAITAYDQWLEERTKAAPP